MNNNPYEILVQLRREAYRKKTGKQPHRYFEQEFKVTKPKTAAQLESLIIEYLNLKGGCFFKVSVTGRQVFKQHQVKDVVGRERTMTEHKYIPSTTRKGVADIVGTYKGKAVAIEVKFSGDRLSDDQKKFRDDWQNSGGMHYVIKTFEQITELI